ncbi:MAG: aminoacyl-histidine dipeptidase [Ruminococcaceae bacterium]|nr:aminoacyl-histidine dipeptidase [Oscillospiraceae bacterium]
MNWNGLKAERVFYWFEQLCAIPHGSGNTKAISDFCVSFAQENGLEWEQDAWNNVIITKSATFGYESEPAIILQGHLDMVCVKEPDKEIDFETDGISLLLDGDFLTAEGTSLGADNGIAVAICMAILESDSLEHPRIEAVFTTDEETGMDGAANIDLSYLQGSQLINIDSEQEGVFTVGCAGGIQVNWFLDIFRQKETGTYGKIEISGLSGGHSGIEIGKESANAIVLLGKLLHDLGSAISVISVTGGEKSNAIPVFACVEFLTMDFEMVKTIVTKKEQEWKLSFGLTDPELLVTVTEEELLETDCFTTDCAKKLSMLLYHYPCGVQSRETSLDGMVRTSLNLGVLTTNENEISGVFCARSSLESEKRDLVNHLISLTEYLGGRVETEGAFPAWEMRHHSPLRDKLSAIYQAQYGREPVIEVIHAGLECGMFSEKIADLDCVSIGPDLFDIHTPAERISISSVGRLWDFILEVLKRK